jgi:hypothetical protein
MEKPSSSVRTGSKGTNLEKDGEERDIETVVDSTNGLLKAAADGKPIPVEVMELILTFVDVEEILPKAEVNMYILNSRHA